MNMLKMIAELRGGIPERCDFCEAQFTEENYPTPEEGGEWACISCVRRWTLLDNVKAGAEQQGDDDKGYEISTQEKYDEFVAKRNYHITGTSNPIDFPVWDEWKPIKDL